ncbi:MAG: hypothetical protein PVI30_11135 [Myxococcales bacterium]
MSKKWALAAVLAGCVVVGLGSTSSVASAQIDTQITDLNTEAMEAYQNLDIDTAGTKLEEAIALAEQNGYVGPEVAVTYLNLGVVYVAGLGDMDQGGAAFLTALCMQPDAQVDPLLSTPDVQQVFMQAQAEARAGGCPGGAGAAPPASVPTPDQYGTDAGYGAGPTTGAASYGAMDEECPPGIVCGGDGERDEGPSDFARFFVNLQFVTGFALVQSGMKADAPPPPAMSRFSDDAAMVPVPEPYLSFSEVISRYQVDHNSDGVVNDGDDLNGDGMPDANGMGAPDVRFYFDDTSAWVPDADSFDDYENADLGIPRGISPVSSKCAADGIATGPLGLPEGYAQVEPSSYCARVETPGFVNNLALRINPGYFITDSFALSLPFRLQFDAGEGTMANMLIGLRGELLFSAMEQATGFPISWFFGATYGQIQAKPPPKDPSGPAPYVISGPLGVHTGINVRYRLHRNFGLIFSPELDVQLPDFMFNMDLALGVEAAF